MPSLPTILARGGPAIQQPLQRSADRAARRWRSSASIGSTVTGEAWAAAAPGIAGRAKAQASLIVLDAGDPGALITRLRESLSAIPGLYAGASATPGGAGAWARLLAADGVALRAGPDRGLGRGANSLHRHITGIASQITRSATFDGDHDLGFATPQARRNCVGAPQRLGQKVRISRDDFASPVPGRQRALEAGDGRHWSDGRGDQRWR